MMDMGNLLDVYPNQWAVLVDKGYQGGAEFMRVVHPKRKPPHGILTVEEENTNKKISSDRIIVENFFGRVCGLWTILGSKYRWSENLYDKIFRMCLGFTNAHIRRHPLRDPDLDFFNKYKNRLYHIGEEVVEKRKRRQERYRRKRQRRLSQQLRQSSSEEEEETQSP